MSTTQPLPSRLDTILETLLPLIGAAIVANGILPPTSPRFPEGWNISAGWPDADGLKSIRYAADDGGYTVAVNDVDPSRVATEKPLTLPILTLNDGTMRPEVARRLQRVQITVWAATGTMRNEIADAILSVVGTDVSSGQILTLPDGTRARMYFVSGPRRIDETIANVQTKRADVLIDVSYGVLGPVASLENIEQGEAIVAIAATSKTITNP